MLEREVDLMDAPQQTKAKKFYLKWPWNLLVYILLVLLLRIFAIPVIALLMAWNKKQQPDGPAEGYCLQRCRQRLTRLVWALLFLVIGLCGLVLFVSEIQADKTGWEASDYVTLVVAGVMGVGGTLLALYEGYTDLRDALSPQNSRLARSIRSQLPYPDDAPDVKELFALVDNDIKENGQWFDRVAVGKEWVLGDEVSAIQRIRVFAGRDEIVQRHSGNRTQTARLVELYILDDRKQTQVTDLRDPKELQALLGCLRLRAPEALEVSYKAFSDYVSKSDEEWYQLESQYQQRLFQRQQQESRQTKAAPSSSDYVYSDLRGLRSSRIDLDQIREQLSQLKEGGRPIGLDILAPIPLQDMEGMSLSALYAWNYQGELYLYVQLLNPAGNKQLLARPAEIWELEDAFEDLLKKRATPSLRDLSQWRAVQAMEQPQAPQRKILRYSDSRGSSREFDSFSRRDVELCGQGLASGKYQALSLHAGSQYLYLQAGDKMDGRVTVNAGRPGPDKLRVYETKCSDRQAQTWLLDFYEERFDPDLSQWKDITKKLEKLSKQ